MTRINNFAAGPAQLPESILKQVQAELLDWRGTGMSVLETNHRGKEFGELLDQADADFRALLEIPSNYQILFLHGGAQTQFAAIPLNFLEDGKSADYLCTGIWGEKAAEEGKRLGKANVVASSKSNQYTAIPEPATWQCDPNASYFHYTANETVHGIEFHQTPKVSAPLIADMSSNILARPIQVSEFAVIYGGIQKNIGPAGLAFMIIRDDLLAREPSPYVPSVLNYRLQVENKSCYNTLPVFPCYMASLMFQWVKAEGGVAEMAKRNAKKAATLYAELDRSGFYINKVVPAARSEMNVVFKLASPALEAEFLAGAERAGLSGLKGHRVVGGLRVSLYNAITQPMVETLIAYMQEFERTRG